MNFDIVYTHSLPVENLNIKESEIMRYMGSRGEIPDAVSGLINTIMPKAVKTMTPKGSFVMKKLTIKDHVISLGEIATESGSLAKNLADCQSVIVFSITVGTGVDRLIAANSSRPSAALVASAIGNAAVEAYADAFVGELKKHFEPLKLYLRPRFSPGYGDFSLSCQRELLTITDSQRRSGLCLTDSMMMTPTKSVTGLIGITSAYDDCPISGCEACNKSDCAYKR